MKTASKFWAISLGILFGFTNALAQQRPVTITPEKPEPGDQVTISYNPQAAAAKIKHPDSLKLVFGDLSSFHQLPNQLTMKQISEGWSTSFQVPEYAVFSSFYFKSGKKTDKGPDNHSYEILVYQDGKIKREAYLYKVFSLRDRYEDKHAILNKIVETYQELLEAYPDSFQGKVRLLSTKMKLDTANSKQIGEKARNLISQKYNQHPDSAEVVQGALSGYRLIGDKAKADSLRQTFIKNNPKSSIAIRQDYRKAIKMEHSAEKRDLLEKITRQTESLRQQFYSHKKLFNYYKKEGDVANMVKQAEELSAIDWPRKVETLNTIAEAFAEQGDRLDLALSYAQQALDQIPDAILNPVYATGEASYIAGYIEETEAKKERNRLRSKVYATFGHIYLKKSQFDKAEQYLVKSQNASDTDAAKKYLGDLYMQTDRPKQAFDAYWDILLKAPNKEKVRQKLKKAYIAHHGSVDGYESKTEKLDQLWRKKMAKKFKKKMRSDEAPPLKKLTDLNGNPVDTDQFKNKVLILDFWATWCGPCRDSFPYLQKVYESYKDNPDIKIIVLNTGRSDNLKDVKKWYENNDYTFPAYYAKDAQITKDYNVKRLPNKIYIGQDGNIRFQSYGFRGPGMVPKMKLKIDMLLGQYNVDESSTS